MSPAMHAKLKSVDPPPQQSSGRAELGRAITRRDELKRRYAAIQAAIETAWRSRVPLRAELEKAEEKIPLADKAATDAAIAQAMGSKVVPASSPAEARAAVRRLEDAIEASKSASAHLDTELKATEAALAAANNDVKSKVAVVVEASPELRSLLNDYRTALATVTALQQVFRELPSLRSAELGSVKQNLPPTWDFRVPDGSAAAGWKLALAALETDASAPLPQV